MAIGVERYGSLLDGFETESHVINLPELSNIVTNSLLKRVPSISQNNLRQMDNVSRYAVLAASLAITDACIACSEVRSERAGVVLGTAFGSLESDMLYHQKLMAADDPSHVNSLIFRNTTSNVAASQISIVFGIKGVNATFTSGAVSGSNAVAHSYDLLREQRANLILSGGIEKIPDVLRDILAISKGANRAKVCDGGAILVLETLEHAQRRGARAYCEIAGYGMADGDHEVIGRAMSSALAEAGVNCDAIDYISPADCIDAYAEEEERAISNLIGRCSKYCQPQGVIARMAFGTAGGFGLANCIWALQRGAKIAVSNDIGFDGSCVSIALKALT